MGGLTSWFWFGALERERGRRNIAVAGREMGKRKRGRKGRKEMKNSDGVSEKGVFLLEYARSIDGMHDSERFLCEVIFDFACSALSSS